MKLQKYAATVVLLFLAVEAQCGLIDSIYGAVKDTTSGLSQDVKNVWSYGKGIVGLESQNYNDTRSEEEKRGLIGGMVHTTIEKVHSVHNYFWNTEEYSIDAGLFGNMYNRVKTRLFKVKGIILGDNVTVTEGQTTPPPSEKTVIIRDALNKLFFGNGTRQVHGKIFRDAIEDLRKKIHEIRNSRTSSSTKSPVYDGENLIDVRTAVKNIKDTVDDNTAGINNNIYDKVDDNINVANDQTAKSYNKVKQNMNDGVNTLRNGIVKLDNELKDKISDATLKENEILGKTYNNLDANATNTKDKVMDTLEEVEKFSY